MDNADPTPAKLQELVDLRSEVDAALKGHDVGVAASVLMASLMEQFVRLCAADNPKVRRHMRQCAVWLTTLADAPAGEVWTIAQAMSEFETKNGRLVKRKRS